MKNMFSLLAVAALALSLGAGCAFKKCSDADGKGKDICENKEKFADNMQCTWKAAAKDADGKCVGPASTGGTTGAGTTAHQPTQDAIDECKAITTDAACNKLDPTTKDAKAKCEWDAKATSDNCKAVAK
ncbi:MAG TPA: hypothetical protein VEK06_02370 [Myxococcota bacterium]|nr:hypothetical protein [Myxococcota bacterium]